MTRGDLVYIATTKEGKLQFLARGTVADKVFIQDDMVTVVVTKVFYSATDRGRKGVQSHNKMWVHVFPSECTGVIRLIFGKLPWSK